MSDQAVTHTLQASDLPDRKPQGSIGTPGTYTPATAELIALRLADGETLSSICRTPGMPSRQCVHQWRMRMPAFDNLYMRARCVGMESMSDDLLTIADDDTLDVLADGSPNHANIQRARLMTDTRKFLLAKLAPKVYGDRVEVEHSGSVDHVVTLSDRERMRRLASFMLEDSAAGVVIEGIALSALPADLTEQAQHAEPDREEPRASDEL